MMLFRFANPAAFLLLLLPPMLWTLRWLLNRRDIQQPVMRFSDARFIKSLPLSWRVRFRRFPDVVRVIAWVLLVLVVARPQSGREQEVIRGEGIDIVLALDISSSMEIGDIGISRLDAAKTQIEQFIADRSFDRVGLVVFASDAYHLVPPTLDYNILRSRLQTVKLAREYNFESGTALGTGIVSAANMLRESDAASRVIVLLTDGSNNRGNVSPVDAARAAGALGVRVYTIGIGRQSLNSQQNTDFDEETLIAIAEATDGLYFRAEDVEGLRRTYEQIGSLERSDVERQVFVRWRERSMGLMIAALLLLLAERITRQTVFRVFP